MKSTTFRQSLLSLSRIQMNTHLCQRIVVLTPTVSYSKITNTPENVDVVSNHSHWMPLHTLIGQIKSTTHSYPFERLAGEVFSDVLGMSTKVDIWSRCHWFLCTMLIRWLFAVGRVGDNNVILSMELVDSGGILLVNEKLLFQLKLELVLSIGFHFQNSHSKLYLIYSSYLLSRWLVIRTIGISPTQSSQDPTNFNPSINKWEVILIYPSWFIGMYIFFGYT